MQTSKHRDHKKKSYAQMELLIFVKITPRVFYLPSFQESLSLKGMALRS